MYIILGLVMVLLYILIIRRFKSKTKFTTMDFSKEVISTKRRRKMKIKYRMY